MSTLQAFITWLASVSSIKAQKKMLERGVFMMPVAGELDGMVKGLFQTARQ